MPEFVALSYCWGSNETPATISCDGKELEVTPNCDAALRRMRMKGRRACVTPIWVDAICIDQSNVEERNQQVTMMGDIYSTAREVRVWLGEGTPMSDHALGYMKKCQWEMFASHILGVLRLSVLQPLCRWLFLRWKRDTSGKSVTCEPMGTSRG